MKAFLLVIAIVTIAPCSSAQNKEIMDSLKILLNNTKNDSARVYLLNKLSLQYGWRNRRDEQLKYLEEGIKLADKIQNIQCQAFGKYALGIYCNAIGKYKEALNSLQQALAILRKFYPSGYIDTVTTVCIFGHIKCKQGIYGEAVQLHQQGFTILRKYHAALN